MATRLVGVILITFVLTFLFSGKLPAAMQTAGGQTHLSLSLIIFIFLQNIFRLTQLMRQYGSSWVRFSFSVKNLHWETLIVSHGVDLPEREVWPTKAWQTKVWPTYETWRNKVTEFQRYHHFKQNKNNLRNF